MATRIFLHNTTSGLPSGTLPSAEQSSLTSVDNFEGSQTTNRLMDTTIGTAQASLANTSLANTSTNNYYVSRWVSPKLKTTTINANTWTYNFAALESAAQANFPVSGTSQPVRVHCYVWKTSNGTKTGTILDGNASSTYNEAGTVNITSEHGTFSGSQVTGATVDDDIIIFEAWFITTQANSTARTQTFYYDGTTETENTGTTVTNHASFIETPQTLFSFDVTRALPTETTTIDETPTRIAGKLKALATQTVALSESVDRVVTPAGGGNNVERGISQTVIISEYLEWIRPEIVSVVDTGQPTITRAKLRSAPTQTTTIAEISIAKLAAKLRSISQTINLSDSVARVVVVPGEIVRSLIETVNIGESINRLAAKIRPVPTQTIASTEQAARQKGKIKSISQSIALSDSIARRLAKLRISTETITIPESLNRRITKARAIATQTTVLTDQIARSVAHQIARALSESITIAAGTASRQLGKIRTRSEVISIIELLEKAVTLINPPATGGGVIPYRRTKKTKGPFYRIRALREAANRSRRNRQIIRKQRENAKDRARLYRQRVRIHPDDR